MPAKAMKTMKAMKARKGMKAMAAKRPRKRFFLAGMDEDEFYEEVAVGNHVTPEKVRAIFKYSFLLAAEQLTDYEVFDLAGMLIMKPQLLPATKRKPPRRTCTIKPTSEFIEFLSER